MDTGATQQRQKHHSSTSHRESRVRPSHRTQKNAPNRLPPVLRSWPHAAYGLVSPEDEEQKSSISGATLVTNKPYLPHGGPSYSEKAPAAAGVVGLDTSGEDSAGLPELLKPWKYSPADQTSTAPPMPPMPPLARAQTGIRETLKAQADAAIARQELTAKPFDQWGPEGPLNTSFTSAELMALIASAALETGLPQVIANATSAALSQPHSMVINASVPTKITFGQLLGGRSQEEIDSLSYDQQVAKVMEWVAIAVAILVAGRCALVVIKDRVWLIGECAEWAAEILKKHCRIGGQAAAASDLDSGTSTAGRQASRSIALSQQLPLV